MNLELIWTNYLGTEHNLGTVGEPTGKYDINGNPVLVGSMVNFTYDKQLRSGRVVKHWLTGNPQILRHECITDEIFATNTVRLESQDRLGDGYVVWVGYGDRPDRIIVREQNVKNHHHDPVKSDNPFGLMSLASIMLKNHELFQPVKPTYDLLLTLFGRTKDGKLKYNPANIDEMIYSDNIRVISPRHGHYFYMFFNTIVPEPLAYICIDETVTHSPTSYLDRIVKSYYFCEHLNARVGMFIESIYTPEEYIEYGNEITAAAIDQCARLLLGRPGDV